MKSANDKGGSNASLEPSVCAHLNFDPKTSIASIHIPDTTDTSFADVSLFLAVHPSFISNTQQQQKKPEGKFFLNIFLYFSLNHV